MSVLLNRAYAGYASGTVVELDPSTEAALIAQGLAVTSSAVPTSGAVTANVTSGSVTVAIGSSSLVVTNALVNTSSKVWACVSQAAADGTLLRVERIVPAAGSFTIYGTANATAATVIDWCLLNPSGMTANS